MSSNKDWQKPLKELQPGDEGYTRPKDYIVGKHGDDFIDMDPDVVITGFPVKDLQDVPIRREDTGDIIINIGGEKRQVIVADKLTEDYFRPLPV
jgi:hypothetical protein